MNAIPALTLSLSVLSTGLAGEAALLPPAQRPAMASFAPLPGPGEGDGLRPEQLPGRITLINLWYEW